MLKANYLSYYYKKTDNGVAKPIFMYLLSGTAENVEKYTGILENQGIPVREDEESGKVIFFTSQPQGRTLEVIITPNDKIVTKDDEIAGLTALMQGENDPVLKEHFAREIANTKVSRMRSMLDVSNRVASAPAVKESTVAETVEESTEQEANLEDLAG